MMSAVTPSLQVISGWRFCSRYSTNTLTSTGRDRLPARSSATTETV